MRHSMTDSPRESVAMNIAELHGPSLHATACCSIRLTRVPRPTTVSASHRIEGAV